MQGFDSRLSRKQSKVSTKIKYLCGIQFPPRNPMKSEEQQGKRVKYPGLETKEACR